MDEEKKPLTDVKNVATVRPVSRLPTPGKSRLPTAGSLSVRQPVMTSNTSKRKAEDEPEVEKKPRNFSGSKPIDSRSSKTRSASVPALNAARSQPSRPPPPRAGSRPPAAPPAKPAAKKASSVPPAAPGKKRAAWDVKGRLQDMEQVNQLLSTQNNMYNDRLAALEAQSNTLKGSVTEKEQVLTSATREIETLEDKLRESRQDLEETRRTLTRKVEDLDFEKSRLSRQKDTLESELTASKQECAGLKSSVATMSSAQAGMSAELTSTKMHLEQMILENKNLKAVVAKHEQTLTEQNDRLMQHELERRVLHNTIQELKGNIRVFCRVRPLIGEELLGNKGEINHLNFPDCDTDCKTIELEKLADVTPNESCVNQRRGSNNVYDFNFDNVFPPSTSQEHVYGEISQLVQSALDGYHVCIFAYGQTGSGKTFTMEGPDNPDTETEGMIPRSVNQVFVSCEQLKDKGWQYDMNVSFLEIYNETIRDLLGCGQDDIKHDIKMTSANSSEVVVTNLTSVKVTQPEQVHKLLAKAGDNRAVAETKCNARSSRSHSVFQMKISGHNTVTDEKCVGLLNLIDLAGSERLKESGSQGQRLKETQSINKSLSNLGNVIMALANKDPHIPYRNSKLTHLLQHCLGGNSKVLMFVNVSPKEECFNETLNSLRFATKVNNCNIGTAQKKVK